MTIRTPISDATNPLSQWERARRRAELVEAVRAITMFASGVGTLESLKMGKLANRSTGNRKG